MTTRLIGALTLAALVNTAAVAAAQPPAPAVDALFKEFTGDRAPGCAAGTTRGGAPLFAKAFGAADLEHAVPLTPQSVFYMGSVSKQFMALAVLLLERDGAIRLDDPVRKYVPELPEHAAAITIRQLLHHTSGLRDYLTLWSLAGHPADSVITERAVLDALARQARLNFAPGAEHLYSNSGYVLLSIVVHRVSGRPADTFARERIFTPLGMSSTRFQHDHTTPIPARAIGYVRRDDTWRIANSLLDVVGDGGMYSTVDDMLRWAAAFDRPEFAPLLARMATPGTLADGRSIENGYGMGLAQGTYRGVPTVSHGGALAGYRTAFLRLPADNLTIVVLCNTATANPMRLAQQTAEHYAPGRMTAAAAASSNGPPPPPPTQPIPRELGDALVGAFYGPELDATYRIAREGDQVRLFVNSREPATLGLIAPDRLRVQGGPELIPVRDAAGRITGLTLNAGRVRDIVFTRR